MGVKDTSTHRGDPVHEARALDADGFVSARFGSTVVCCRSARPDAGVLDRSAAEPVTVLDEHSAVRQEIERAIDGDGAKLDGEIISGHIINRKRATGIRDRRTDDAKCRGVVFDCGDGAFVRSDVTVKSRIGDGEASTGDHRNCTIVIRARDGTD